MNGRSAGTRSRRQRGSWGGRILILLAILALLSVIAMAQFLLKGAMNNDQGSGDGGTRAAPRRRPARTPSATTGGKAKIVARQGLRPGAGRQRVEHPEDVKNTYDGKPSTTWKTQSYKKQAEPRRH